MTELSPAAQAVLDASKSVYWRPLIDVPYCQSRVVAAALRAAADQLGECRAPGAEFEDLYPRIIEVDELLAIADELEAK